MTPLGLHLRALRAQRQVTQKDMADAIGVSPAYLSALEHGRRGQPSWALLQRIVGYFNVIWDDADTLQKLASLSDPKITIDTSDLSAAATHMANLLAHNIDKLDENQIEQILELLQTSNGS
ncbi:MAG: helix-turn-helix domain-containing protein [Rhizobiaceae bacterium]|nr:helix-turn-helix domain-containing protein [Rhizobiaceae bacterium]